ncbi:MAG: hypothetical protein Q6L19_05410, partial [Gloeomargarita sp. GMQP_bins_69]
GQLQIPDWRVLQEVATALTQLAQQPTASHWQVAQAALQALDRDFDHWRGVQPWQIQTWRARLKSLTNLLLYGARVQLGQPASALSQPLPPLGRPTPWIRISEQP